MASHGDYIPSAQEALRTFMNNAASHLVLDPGRFSLMVDEANSFKERTDQFDSLLTISLDPATRNAGSVADKNLARVEMLQLARPMLKRIRDTAGVSPADKVLLGLRLPDLDPSPIAVPQSLPILEIIATTPLVHVIMYHDELTPDSGAKPIGAAALQLFSMVNPTTPPTDPEEARFVAVITRQRHRVNYASGQALKTVYYWARWQSAKGEVGPWSQVVAKVVPA